MSIQIKRYTLASSLPSLALDGQPVYAKDTQELYIGTGVGLVPIKVAATNISGLILAGLGDVNISSPIDGQYLVYNAGSGKWVNMTPPAPDVISVNGKNGVVVLTYSDVGADAAGAAATAQSNAEAFATSADITVLASAESYTNTAIQAVPGLAFTPAGVPSPSPAYSPADGPSDMNYCIFIKDANGNWHEQAGVNTTINNTGSVDGTLTWVRQQYYTDTAAPATLPGKNAFMAITHANGVNMAQLTTQDRALHVQQSNVYGAITSYSIASGNVVTFNIGGGSVAFNGLAMAFVPGQIVFASGLTTTDGKLLNGWLFQVQSATKTSCVAVPYPFALTAAANASGGNTTYSGSIWQGNVFSFVGQTVTISGFTNAANNGTFTVVSNAFNNIVVNNPSGVAETHAGGVQVAGLPTIGTTGDPGALNQPIYGIDGIQCEVDVQGTPFMTGSPDGEICAGSFQCTDDCIGTPSSPNNLGLSAIRAQIYRNGTGNFSGAALPYAAINAIAQQNNATGVISNPVIMAAVSAQCTDFGGAPYARGYAVYIPFSHRLSAANYGLYVGDYGSTGSSAITITAVANASSGSTVYTVSGGEVLTTNCLGSSQSFTITGCQNAANNGTFRVASNTSTTITFFNASGVAESGSSGKAVSTNDYAIYSVGGQVYIGGTVTSNTTFSGNPAFTGTPTFSNALALPTGTTATTPSTADNSTKVATTAYVQAQGYVNAVTNDTNITGSIASGNLTLGWAGTLAAGRLNSNVVQAVTNDTNITGSITSQNLTLGWAGTLAAARLNSNVVQSIVNDTNITGSISAQALTLGWAGTLAAGRLNANVVQSVVNDTNIQGAISAQALTFSWSGLLGLARGGTNADLSATGGTSQVLRQSSAGAAITVSQLAYSDITGISTIAHTGAWSDLQNATANLTLANAGFTTEFDQTSAVTWTWKNTTASTLDSNVSSPILRVVGTYFGSAGGVLAASGDDTWSIQNVVANGVQLTGTGVITNISESSGSVVTLTLASPSFTPAVGSVFVITGMGTGNGDWLNGYSVTLLTASGSSCTFNDPTAHGTYASHATTGTPTMTKVSGISTLSFVHGGSPSQTNSADASGQQTTVAFPQANFLSIGTPNSISGGLILNSAASANGVAVYYPNATGNGTLYWGGITNGVLAGGAISFVAAAFNISDQQGNQISISNAGHITSATSWTAQGAGSSNLYTLNVLNTTAATSGQSQSTAIAIQGRYWTGAASAIDTWTIENLIANGTNGTSTLSITHSGSSGAATISIPTLVANGGQIVNRAAKSGNYTTTKSDYVLVFTATATCTLDSSVAVSGTTYRIKLSTSAAGGSVLTVSPNNSKTIEGVASTTISTLGQSIDVVYDGSSNWEIF